MPEGERSGKRKPVRTRVIADVDFDRAGKQFAALRLPYSHNDSAWGTVAIPIVVINNGSRPTLMLTAGTHGDEYEGQIALLDLARELQPGEMRGRLIIIPALHLPAAQAGTRLSPIDNRDLNRTFPGDPDGSFAYMLSHYVTEVLLALADAHVDLHSGGRSLDCLPCTMSHILDDQAVMDRTVVLAKAFGAPYHVMNREVDGSHTFLATAERLGVLSMSSELGGGNRVSLRGLAITKRGVHNLLKHCKMIAGEAEPFEAPTRIMLLPDADSYHFAPCAGIYRPFHALGTWVKAGEAAGAIYSIEDPSRSPTILEYRRSGMLWTTRGQGRIAAGDSAAVVVSERQ
ncbi:MAG: succinylglutamate desuccinylase/aspartoacylase family protein [Pseudomonadota bacterium]